MVDKDNPGVTISETTSLDQTRPMAEIILEMSRLVMKTLCSILKKMKIYGKGKAYHLFSCYGAS